MKIIESEEKLMQNKYFCRIIQKCKILFVYYNIIKADASVSA